MEHEQETGGEAYERHTSTSYGLRSFVQVMALGMMILSLISPRLFLPLLMGGGLFALLGSFAIPGSTVHTCGACGNVVAGTSRVCPTCSSRLSAAPEGVSQGMRLLFIIAIGMILVGLAYRLAP